MLLAITLAVYVEQMLAVLATAIILDLLLPIAMPTVSAERTTMTAAS